jgi:hypothetical protein
MSNRKPGMASKRAHTAKKITHKAQRATQAVVRSPIAGRAPAADSTKSLPEHQSETDKEARLVDSPAMVLEDETRQTMADTESKGELEFSPALAGVGAYQAKLLEMGQANMKLAWEFAQRLAWIRSPFEFPSVIAEFTTKRIDLLRKHSKELVELTIRR